MLNEIVRADNLIDQRGVFTCPRIVLTHLCKQFKREALNTSIMSTGKSFIAQLEFQNIYSFKW